MPDSGIFGLDFEKDIVIFEISTLEQICQIEKFKKKKKKKCLDLVSKMPSCVFFD